MEKILILLDVLKTPSRISFGYSDQSWEEHSVGIYEIIKEKDEIKIVLEEIKDHVEKLFLYVDGGLFMTYDIGYKVNGKLTWRLSVGEVM